MTRRATNIVAFIRDRLEQDRTIALAAGGKAWRQYDPLREHGRIEEVGGDVVTYDEGSPTEGQAVHIARHDPARVLRDVQADLAVLFEHDEAECCSTCLDDVDGCPTFRALAYKHADHPEWQPHWKPEESR